MNEFILLLALVVPLTLLVIWFTRKIIANRLVANFMTLFLVNQSVLVILSYGIGQLGGLSHFLWAIPIAILLVIVSMQHLYISYNRYKTGVSELSNQIKAFSEGDMTVRVSVDLQKQKNEIGVIAVALHTLINQMSHIMQAVIHSSNNISTTCNQLVSSSSNMHKKVTHLEQISVKVGSAVSNSNETASLSKNTDIASDSFIELNSDNIQAIKKLPEIIQITNRLAAETNNVTRQSSSELVQSSNTANDLDKASVNHAEDYMQIKLALQQLNKVSQHSRTASEEISIDANELSKQVQYLKDMTSFFRLN